MFDLIQETDLTNMYDLHQNVTVNYGKSARWARRGRRLVVRSDTALEGICRPVPSVKTGDIITFWSQTIPHVKKRFGEQSKRVCLRSDSDRVLWFKSKGEKHGFVFSRIPKMTTEVVKNPWSPKPFLTTLFEGTLQVSDAELFNTMMRNGIGSVKMGGNIMIIENID